jgi:Flp pilus assembly protein TadD
MVDSRGVSGGARRYIPRMDLSPASGVAPKFSLKVVWVCIGLVWAGCSADHHSAKGKAAQEAHDLAAAERHYRDAIARDPAHTEALAGLGWVYLLAGQTDAAAGSFFQCVAADPQSPECLRGSAAVASGKGQPAEARRLLNEALVLDPHHSGVLSSLALLDLAGGELETATRRYLQLVEREPDRAEFRLGLAEVKLRSKAYDEALAQIEAGLGVKNSPKRTRAMLLQTQARALVSATANRVKPDDCAGTVGAVSAWLDAADEAVTQAEASGVSLPDLRVVKRRVRNQRIRVTEMCPPPR